MESEERKSEEIDREISKSLKNLGEEQEQKIINVVIEIIVEMTLKNFYEESN